MSEFFSEWGVSESPLRHISDAAELSPRVWNSAEASPTTTDVQAPGGYLAWVRKTSSGVSTVHGCRVHQTVESSIIDVEDLTANSRIDAYDPPAGMSSTGGHFPFAPTATVYISGGGNPKILCLSTGLEVFAVDSSGSENKESGVLLYDRPTRIVAGKFRGQSIAGTCMKMLNGDVAFMIMPDTADNSSSSSSSYE